MRSDNSEQSMDRLRDFMTKVGLTLIAAGFAAAVVLGVANMALVFAVRYLGIQIDIKRETLLLIDLIGGGIIFAAVVVRVIIVEMKGNRTGREKQNHLG